MRNTPTRRDVLQAGALGFMGLSLFDWLRIAEAESPRHSTADSVLFINLAGGPSHLDTLDMKPEGPAETRGVFKSIASSLPGLAVCEHLPRIAQLADQVSLIRGISHTTGDPPQGQAYIATGNRPNPAVQYPSYGSVVTKEMPGDADLPNYVAVPQTEWGAGYLGDAFAPFNTNAVPKSGRPFSVRGLTLANGLTIEKVERRERLLRDIDSAFQRLQTNSRLLDALDKLGQQAYRMITSPRTRAAFDVNQEPEGVRRLFADNELGQSLLLATRLIEQGIRFVTVTNTGWDTHLDNFRGHQKLMPPLDAGFAAALEALSQKGLLARTLVVMMGEFGRTPKINANVGRDHYPRANWCVMAGGGVRPGQLIGGTDANGEAPNDGTDIRPDDIGASILCALGIDHLTEYATQAGRPIRLIPHGRIIPNLFG